MKDGKVRKNPINHWCTEIAVQDIHRSHLSSRHHSSYVKLLGVVEVRGLPKNLCKLRKLDRKHAPIGHPHKDHLFLVKEKSGMKF
jgi:hypothetical protein